MLHTTYQSNTSLRGSAEDTFFLLGAMVTRDFHGVNSFEQLLKGTILVTYMLSLITIHC